MSERPQVYFPSLYDRSASRSPVEDSSIWKNLLLPVKGHRPPYNQPAESSPWPPGLAEIRYEPLWFFTTSLVREYTPEASRLDEICELEIMIKEVELLTIIGDLYDSKTYMFLKSLREQKLYELKLEAQLKKQAMKPQRVNLMENNNLSALYRMY